MSTDRYEEFRAKAINSKEMFTDLVNKTESGFKMYKVKALGADSYLSRFLVKGDCFDLPEDGSNSEEERCPHFHFEATVLKEDDQPDFEFSQEKYSLRTNIESSSNTGITGSFGTRNLSFLNLEDAMEYLNWEKNDPARIQAREDEKKNGIVYSLLRLY